MSPPKEDIDTVDLFYRIKALEEWKGELRTMFHELITKVDGLRSQMDRQPIGFEELERRINALDSDNKSTKAAMNTLFRLYYICVGGITVIAAAWGIIKEFLH